MKGPNDLFPFGSKREGPTLLTAQDAGIQLETLRPRQIQSRAPRGSRRHNRPVTRVRAGGPPCGACSPVTTMSPRAGKAGRSVRSAAHLQFLYDLGQLANPSLCLVQYVLSLRYNRFGTP
jgi:hypothetical protein